MKRLLLLFILSFSVTGSFAQDFHLSQYDAAALNFNPAMTGMFKGQIRVHGHYRNQWSALATKPFVTGLLSVDAPVGKFALGAQVANFRAGTGNYNVFSFLGSLSYDIKMSKNNAHHLVLGVQGGLFQKSVDYSKLTWGLQYSPFNGGSFDQTLSPGEPLAGNTILKGDLNAGLLYYYGKETALLNPFIGGSVFHINQPAETFFSQDNRLPIRWIGHAGVKVNVSERIQLTPKAFYMGEKNARELTYGIDIHYFLRDSDSYIIFSPVMRDKDAAIATLGLKSGKFIYRVSYDINTSTLQPTTSGKGGFELSVTFINKKVNPNPIKTCPRL
jgi:type IX secretion system PorP/SprF family membrane protein